MNEMVERVARALAELKIRTNRRHDTSPDRIEQMISKHRVVDHTWQDQVNAARAAIEAMREPTEKMIDAGTNADWVGENESRAGLSIMPNSDHDHYEEWPIEICEVCKSPGIWPAMIDTALQTEPEKRG